MCSGSPARLTLLLVLPVGATVVVDKPKLPLPPPLLSPPLNNCDAPPPLLEFEVEVPLLLEVEVPLPLGGEDRAVLSVSPVTAVVSPVTTSRAVGAAPDEDGDDGAACDDSGL